MDTPTQGYHLLVSEHFTIEILLAGIVVNHERQGHNHSRHSAKVMLDMGAVPRHHLEISTRFCKFVFLHQITWPMLPLKLATAHTTSNQCVAVEQKHHTKLFSLSQRKGNNQVNVHIGLCR